MSLPLDGLGGLLLSVGAAVLLYLIGLTWLLRRPRLAKPRRKKGPVAAPPGWYADPNEPQTMRFWDGQKWTDSPAD